MNVIPGDIIIEPASSRQATQSQPVQAIAPEVPFDDAKVREAIMKAEANNLDPQTITLDEFAQGRVNTIPLEAPIPAVEVPPKFLKSDGSVDVDKLQASTATLETAVQQKEAKLQEATKSVDDLVKHYMGLEKRFTSTPNPERVLAQIPQAPPPPPQINPQQMSQQQLEDAINADFQRNPGRTMVELLNIGLSQRLQPLEEREKIQSVRENVEKLAKNDPRVLQHFDAITAKIESDPELRRLKNPHRAAWLEVKEDLRLGELSQAQAQPSRPLSPVLGGGTPPSVPSASVPSPQNVLSNLSSLDIRDKKQEALGDEAVRRALMGNRG
jgi:hypothetical protein